MQVRSRFGQRGSPAHGGQVHVRTRPLGRAKLFWRVVGVVSHHEVVNAWSTEATPGRIGVRTNWAYHLGGQGRFRTKMPKFRKFCPDKNGRFREIWWSNIYGDYQGSCCWIWKSINQRYDNIRSLDGQNTPGARSRRYWRILQVIRQMWQFTL